MRNWCVFGSLKSVPINFHYERVGYGERKGAAIIVGVRNLPELGRELVVVPPAEYLAAHTSRHVDQLSNLHVMRVDLVIAGTSGSYKLADDRSDHAGPARDVETCRCHEH